MKKNSFVKRVLCLVLALVACISVFPMAASAAVASKSTMDGILSSWNSSSYTSLSSSYKGASQCAAFSRYVFVKLYGHTDQLGNSNNTVTINSTTSVDQLLTWLKTKAAPGDAVRVTGKSEADSHIMHLYDIDSSGKITVYESNYDDSTNKGRCHTYSSITTLVEDCTDATVTKDKISYTIELKIIHSSKNSNTCKAFSCNKTSCSSHSYSGGICTKCGAEYAYSVIAMNATAYKVTKSGGAPIWSRPYSNNSTKVTTMAKGSTVMVIGKTTNQAGNLWYLLSDGTWIYSGNASKITTPSGIRYVKGTDGSLNIRSTASTSGKILGSIPEGASVIVNTSKTSGSWIYVTYNGVSGYASSKYLTTTAPNANSYT